jgi:hypothetical protein
MKRPGRVRNRLVALRQFIPVPHRDWSEQPPNKIQRAVQAACRALMEAEVRLTDLDRAVGDGDLGVTLARGARAVEKNLPMYQLYNPAEVFKAMGLTFQKVVGGSSGPFYAVLLLRAANSLRVGSIDDPKAWAKASLDACDAISELGDESAGDRTMLDALVPFATRWPPLWNRVCQPLMPLRSESVQRKREPKRLHVWSRGVAARVISVTGLSATQIRVQSQ